MQHIQVSALHLIFHQEVIKVIQPVLLGKIIEYFESYDPTDTAAVYEAYSYAAGISLSTIGLAVLHHLYFYHVQRAGMKIRVAMCHMIYRKVSHYETSVSKCNALSYLCGFVGLDLTPLFCKGSLSQQQSVGQNYHRTNCKPLIQRCQQV